MKWYSSSKENHLRLFEYEDEYEYRDAEYEKTEPCPTIIPE
jgi:hypothetical protein